MLGVCEVEEVMGVRGFPKGAQAVPRGQHRLGGEEKGVGGGGGCRDQQRVECRTVHAK